jgi:bifunctional DNase/RNase
VVALTIHGLAWCWRHGHPTVGLRAADDEVYWLTLSAEDAQALSPLYQSSETGRARLYGLIEVLVASLEGRVTRVSLRLGAWNTLTATLEVDGPPGRQGVPAHPVDAIILAWRLNLPITMEDADYQQLGRLRDAQQGLAELAAAERAAADVPPEPFRQLIESLDLGQFGTPDKDG